MGNYILLILVQASIKMAQKSVQSLPGYGAPELQHGLISALADIYSFGRLFYVLRHQCFPEDHKLSASQDAIDKFLLRCCEIDPKKRYRDMKELDKAYQAIVHKTLQWKNKLLLSLMLCCISCALFSNYQYEKEKEITYLQLIEKQDYEEAILYQSDDLRAYQCFLKQAEKEHQLKGKILALKRISQIYENYPLSMNEEIACYLIQECVLTKELSLYEYALRLIKEIKADAYEKNYESALSLILQKQDVMSSLKVLYQKLDDPKDMSDKKVDLLVALYETQSDQLAQTYEFLLPLYELQHASSKKIELQYAYGLWLCEQKDVSIFSFVEQLENEWDIKEAYHLGNLYLEIFEKCIVDEEKSNRMDLLDKANMYIDMVKEDTNREAMLQQVTYLQKKWKR
ncbi:hypothetical protein [[Eubacterium] hominis]|uniref:hypothetical protein n=1 Tax=[Eubacterium] hominis TaxID=2764325 RepID=UPI003A4DD1AA